MRTHYFLLTLALTVFACGGGEAPLENATQVEEPDASASTDAVRRLHEETPLIDGHNDLPGKYRENVNLQFSELDIATNQPQLMTDIPRLRAGGVGAQFWSVYVPADLMGAEPVRATMEQIDVVYEMVRRYPETFEIAFTADDVERVFASGKIASLIGMEGGHSIDSSLGALRMFYRLGARYMTLTHSRNTPWADSSTDREEHGGLSEFGSEVVREMNWLGMLVDLSHVSPGTMHDVLDVVEAPVIYSHSSAKALCDHPRNVPDDVLERLPENGGVVMVTFVPQFLSQEVRDHDQRQGAEQARLQGVSGASAQSVADGLEAWNRENPAPRATLAQAADHIDHIRDVAGIDHIGLGSDFDGITSVPEGLEDVSKFVDLSRELDARGYSGDDIKKILGDNVLRVMRLTEQAAARLQLERGPSESVFPGREGWN